MKHYAHIEGKNRQIYAAMVHAVDRGVGELVGALKLTGVFENTLIVFLSDNGGKLSLGANNGPLREGKGSAYEGGYRTPMLFHWPEGLPAERSYNHPVTSLDFYPTFAELADARVQATKKLDGRNIMPAVVAKRDARPGEMIYVLRHRKAYHDVGGRIDNWKEGEEWRADGMPRYDETFGNP